MAVVSDGSYGVPEGLISSFPVTTKGGNWSIVTGLEIDDFSRGRIDKSTAELADEREGRHRPGPDLRHGTSTLCRLGLLMSSQYPEAVSELLESIQTRNESGAITDAEIFEAHLGRQAFGGPDDPAGYSALAVDRVHARGRSGQPSDRRRPHLGRPLHVGGPSGRGGQRRQRSPRPR